MSFLHRIDLWLRFTEKAGHQVRALPHRIDMLLTLAGWVHNPVSLAIERAYWRTLEADMAEFRAGRML